MTNLLMISDTFKHDCSSTNGKKPNSFSWVYDIALSSNNLSFYIDNDLSVGINQKDGRKKFLWLLESQEINNYVVEKVKSNLSDVLTNYELIFTYSDELLLINPKFVFSPAQGIWVKEPKLHSKTKLTSMICSNKNSTKNQAFRCEYAIENKHMFDLYGRGFKEIEYKEEGLADYMFSICIENHDYDTYFTEKILDCFATGTIPIYKGTRKVIKHFNPDGILFLDDIELEKLTPELYYSKIRAVEENFELCRKFNILDDYLYDNYLKSYI